MMFTEAIESFEELLNEDSNYFPALKGIAEAYYGLAQHLLKLQFVGRSHDIIQKSIDSIIK